MSLLAILIALVVGGLISGALARLALHRRFVQHRPLTRRP
jgi:hypothetical protein